MGTRSEEEPDRQRLRDVLAALAYLVPLALLAGCAGRTNGHVYRVPSSSMEPTLHCAKPAPGCVADQRDLVYAVPYAKGNAPRRGDIVVFETPPAAAFRCGAGGVYIKRVIGLPRERWRERRGRILIDGKTLEEPWVAPDRRDTQTLPGGPLAPRHYLLLGDNRPSSCDSRIYGPVALSAIRGKVVEIKRGSERIHLR